MNFLIAYKDVLALFIQSLGVLATFGAVCVSLYLARKQTKLILKVSVDIRKITGSEGHYYLVHESIPATGEKVLCFYIRNLGTATLTLQETSFFVDFNIPTKALTCAALDAKWTSYPKKIASNEDLCIAVSDYNALIKDIAKDKDFIQKLQKIRPFITTGAGKRIYAHMDNHTKKRIIQDIKSVAKEHETGNQNTNSLNNR